MGKALKDDMAALHVSAFQALTPGDRARDRIHEVHLQDLLIRSQRRRHIVNRDAITPGVGLACWWERRTNRNAR